MRLRNYFNGNNSCHCCTEGSCSSDRKPNFGSILFGIKGSFISGSVGSPSIALPICVTAGLDLLFLQYRNQ